MDNLFEFLTYLVQIVQTEYITLGIILFLVVYIIALVRSSVVFRDCKSLRKEVKRLNEIADKDKQAYLQKRAQKGRS